MWINIWEKDRVASAKNLGKVTSESLVEDTSRTAPRGKDAWGRVKSNGLEDSPACGNKVEMVEKNCKHRNGNGKLCVHSLSAKQVKDCN